MKKARLIPLLLALVMALTMYRRINRSLSLPGGGSGDKTEN